MGAKAVLRPMLMTSSSKTRDLYAHLFIVFQGFRMCFFDNRLPSHASTAEFQFTTSRHKLSIYCTQFVPLTRSNTYRNVASRLLAGLVEHDRVICAENDMRGIALRGNAPRGNDYARS